MKTYPYEVWEDEYPELGSWLTRATSAAAAKRWYRRRTGVPEVALRASRLTVKQVRERKEAP